MVNSALPTLYDPILMADQYLDISQKWCKIGTVTVDGCFLWCYFQ